MAIGYFSLELCVLNSGKNSPLARQKPRSEGSYGQIYSFPFFGEKIAIKSFRLSSEEEKVQNTIAKVIHEYCVMRVCHFLGCGPFAPRYLGYDIVIFNDAAEFAMEECAAVRVEADFMQQMLVGLGTMHRFRIMHMDINSDNVMYSPRRGKNVFIDFGFSEVIAEECGRKTKTAFRGTPQFVSFEMFQLFTLTSESAYVDLYYNDLVCLQNSEKYAQEYLQEQKVLTVIEV